MRARPRLPADGWPRSLPTRGREGRVYEDVHVAVADDDAFEVEARMRLVVGVAAGDVIRADSGGDLTVTQLGGNLAIQLSDPLRPRRSWSMHWAGWAAGSMPATDD